MSNANHTDMLPPAFIAGDWGTSNLRLFFCDANGTLLQQVRGPGIAELHANAQAQSGKPLDWLALLNQLAADNSTLPVLLCGMVGSTIGWQPVPYLPCPLTLTTLAQHVTRIPNHSQRIIAIAPGLSCTNRNNAPDVMRGEETQLLGATRLLPHLTQGKHLLCLPGTHAKWALLVDGKIMEFTTAATGEVFDVITRHSVLVQSTRISEESQPFLRGLDQLRAHDGALLQLIFECRSRQLHHELSANEAAAYLSGLLMGADVLAAMRHYPALPITLIGSPALTARYALACHHFGAQATTLEGDAAVLAGLTACYQEMIQ